MQSLVYFALLLGGLIFFHEFGHFLFARLMGVRVETFSIGFGPALFKWKRGDTEYKLALIPLGGYVKMTGDEPFQEVSEELRAVSFNYKPLWKRALVVAAGPIFNLILPFIVFFILFLTYTDLTPAYVGSLKEGGPAWNAGLRSGDSVIGVNGEPIKYWWEMQEAVNASISQPMTMKIRRGDQEFETEVTPEETLEVRIRELNLVQREGRIQVVPMYVKAVLGVTPGSAAEKAGLQNWDWVQTVDGVQVDSFADLETRLAQPGSHTLGVLREEPLGAAGPWAWALFSNHQKITLEGGGDPGLFSAEMLVHRVDPETPAAALGLQKGDRVISIDDQTYPLWSLLIYKLADEITDEHVLIWERDGERYKGTFQLAEKTEKGEFKEDRQVLIFGAYNHSAYGLPELIPNDRPFAYSALQTWLKTKDAFQVTVLSLAGLFSGKVKMKDVGGPILIYDMASKTAEHGWEYFFRIMVWLSVSLGLINLIPIPILDGGHLFFFLIEAVIRRPVSMKIRQIAAYLGLVLIVLLMVVVLINDIQRNWGNITEWF